MEVVVFVDEKQIRASVRRAFLKHKRKLEQLLPTAEVIHVGSTAVPGSLTKGDLDIQVRVPRNQFPEARATLARHYERNRGSSSTATFASFKNDDLTPQLGIQLTVFGSRYDTFWWITAYLATHPETNQEYNELKLHYQGRSMATYRRAKSRFLESLLTTKRQSPRPHRRLRRSSLPRRTRLRSESRG